MAASSPAASVSTRSHKQSIVDTAIQQLSSKNLFLEEPVDSNNQNFNKLIAGRSTHFSVDSSIQSTERNLVGHSENRVESEHLDTKSPLGAAEATTPSDFKKNFDNNTASEVSFVPGDSKGLVKPERVSSIVSHQSISHSVSKSIPEKNESLLGVPPELRNKIYDYIYSNPKKGTHIDSIYAEMKGMQAASYRDYWTNNTFALDVWNSNHPYMLDNKDSMHIKTFKFCFDEYSVEFCNDSCRGWTHGTLNKADRSYLIDNHELDGVLSMLGGQGVLGVENGLSVAYVAMLSDGVADVAEDLIFEVAENGS